MRRFRSIALLATTIATTIATSVALLVPSSASAENLVIQDGRGDYWHDHRGDGDPGTPDQHAPDWGDPDLLRTAYRHGTDKVRVRLKMARLSKRDGGYWRVEVRLRTDEGRRGTATLFKPHDGQVVVGWTGPGKCFIDPHVDYPDDAFVLDISTRCLSRPREIEFKSATRWWPTSDDVAYLDVSGQAGYRLGPWSAPVGRG